MKLFPLFALFVIRATGGYQFQAVAGAAPLLVASGYDYARVGLLIGAYMLPGIFVTVPAGILSRRLGDKPVVAAGLCLMLAGAALMALTDSFPMLIAGRVLSGVGGLAVLMLVIKMTADRYAGPFLSTATAVVVTSWYVGFAGSLVVSSQLAVIGDARLALAASGLPALLGLVMLPFVGTPRAAPPSGPAAAPARVPWRFIAAAALCWTLMNVSFAVLIGFLPAYLVARGLSAPEAGATGSILSWSSAATTIAGGYVADRLLGRTATVIVGMVAGALLTALIPLAAGAVPVLVACGLAFALFPAALTAQVGQATPPAARGVVFGWYSGASYVGLSLVPWLAGVLRDASGQPSAPIFLASLFLVAMLPAYAWFLRTARGLSSSATGQA
jgi:MFS family permease